MLFQLAKMGGKVMNADAGGEGIRFVAGKKFDQVLEIRQCVIDRRGGEMKHLLVCAEVVKRPVARAAGFASEAAITKMVGFVNDDGIRLIRHLFKDGREIRAVGADAAHEVGVIENFEREEAVQKMRQIFSYVPLPDRHAAGLGDEQDDALLLIHHQPLNEHEADEGFPQADAIAKECAIVIGGGVIERGVAVALVLIEDGIDFGFGLFPFAGG